MDCRANEIRTSKLAGIRIPTLVNSLCKLWHNDDLKVAAICLCLKEASFYPGRAKNLENVFEILFREKDVKYTVVLNSRET